MITSVQYKLLIEIKKADGKRNSISGLSKKICTKPHATASIKKLKDMGLIKTEKDGRAKKNLLTKKGEELLKLWEE